MKTSLLYLILLTLPVSRDTGSIDIQTGDSGSSASELFIELKNPDGTDAREFQLGQRAEVEPGPWFGSPTPSPTISSPGTATWIWKNLSPGTYEIRFQATNATWIVTARLDPGIKKEITLLTPESSSVHGELHNSRGKAEGVTVSAISRKMDGEDRILWKTWTKTDQQGSYTLPLVSETSAKIDSQVFLDDDNPRVLAWNSRLPMVSGDHFRSSSIWAHSMPHDAPARFDAGITRVQLCEGSILLKGAFPSGAKAWIFVPIESEFDFQYHERKKRTWKKFRTMENLSKTPRLSGLPEGEILVVIRSDFSPDKLHSGAFYKRVTLVAGETIEVQDNVPLRSGEVTVTLPNVPYEGEQEYARIRRSIVLFPQDLLDAGTPELAEAFEYVFPWKARQIRVTGMKEGAYTSWKERTPWFEIDSINEHLPLGVVTRALWKKIQAETITPESLKFILRKEERHTLTFMTRQGN